MGFSQLMGTSETPSPFLFLLSEVQAKHSVGSLLGHLKQSKEPPGLPWGPVVENPPASAGDTDSIPGLRRFHMPLSS